MKMLTYEQKRDIINLRKAGMPIKEIARKYHVSRGRISQITLYEVEKIEEYLAKKLLWENVEKIG
jgi:transcriptional regulator